MESASRESGTSLEDLSLGALDQLWQEAKRADPGLQQDQP